MGTFCHGRLNYLRDGAPVALEVEIRDGREAELPGWEECGFELVRHPSAVADWDDDEQVASVHHPEVEQLARTMTGADVALVSGHIRRSPEAARRHEQLSPITFAHSDFAAGYDQNIRDRYLQEAPEAAAALRRNGITAQQVRDAPRVVILQFWRNLGPAKMDHPLAFCDARTVTVEQGLPIHIEDYAGTGATFEALALRAPDDPDENDWYAFPELVPDEAVAFRTYDTELVDEGAVWFTPHSAFNDPEVEPGRPARSSIELRATCLYL